MAFCAPQFGQHRQQLQQRQQQTQPQPAPKPATESSKKPRWRLRPTTEKFEGYAVFIRMDNGRKVYSNGKKGVWMAVPDNPSRDRLLAEQGKLEQLIRITSSHSNREVEESSTKKTPAEAVSGYARYVMSEAKNSGASPYGMVLAVLEIGGWHIDPDDHGSRGTSTVLVHTETGGRVEVFGAAPQEMDSEAPKSATPRKNRKVHGKKYANLSEAEVSARKEAQRSDPRTASDRKRGKGRGGKGKK